MLLDGKIKKNLKNCCKVFVMFVDQKNYIFFANSDGKKAARSMGVYNICRYVYRAIARKN